MPSRITIDIENRSGVKQGPGPIATATSLEYGDALSRAAGFSFAMPGRDSRGDLLQAKLSVVRIWEDGSQVFLGIVEGLDRSADDRGEVVLTVSGRNMLAELTERVVTATGDRRIVLSGTGTAATLVSLTATWSQDTSPPSPLTGYSTTANSVYGVFGGLTVLAGLVRVHELTGEHFIYSSDNDRKIIWLRDTIADSGVRAVQGGADPVGLATNANVCVIRSLERVEDAHEVYNRVIPFGGGLGGDSMIPMSASSYASGTSGNFDVDISNNRIEDTTALGYGSITLEAYLNVPDATLSDYSDANLTSAGDMVVEAGMRWLEWHGQPHVFYGLEVMGLPASVRAGMSVRIVYEDDALSVDDDFTLLEIVRRVASDGSRTARLLVGSIDRWPMDNSEAVVQHQAQGDAFLMATQALRSFHELAFVENFDDTYSAYCDFDLNDAMLRVESVILKFDIDDYRSTVKSVTNNEVETDPASPGSTDSGGSHFHSITVVDSTSGNNMNFSGGSPGSLHASGGGSVTTQSAGAHTHTHSTTHVHTVTSNVAITAGILVQGPTATTGQVTFFINGGSPTNSVSGPDGQGWYTLDLTPDVRDSTTFRPTQVANRLSVVADSGKYGLLRARVQIKAFV